jgi:hypothetical protein
MISFDPDFPRADEYPSGAHQIGASKSETRGHAR